MIVVRHPRFGRFLPTVWFPEHDGQLWQVSMVFRVRGAAVPIVSVLPKDYVLLHESEQETLITNLSDSEQKIFGAFNETTRYEIRRAQRLLQEDTRYTISSPGQWSNLQKKLLCDFLTRKQLEPWVAAHGLDNFYLTPFFVTSSVDFQQSSLIVHTYIADEEAGIVWLYWSASPVDAAVERRLIGWLNRLLHWRDMLWFRENGFVTYDWGGAGISPDVVNITRFKMGFGGTPIKRYFGLVAHRWIAPFVRMILPYTRR